MLEVRLIPAKKDIAFVEYADEASATVAKEALHNFKIDGETKMKASSRFRSYLLFRPFADFPELSCHSGFLRKKIGALGAVVVFSNSSRNAMYISYGLRFDYRPSGIICSLWKLVLGTCYIDTDRPYVL